jgi:outer membrane protein assembly factor BamB
VHRDRTTTSCLLIGPLVAWALSLSTFIDAQSTAVKQTSQVFPSDPVWTVDVSARPVGSPVAAADRLFLPLQSGISARRLSDGGEIWAAKVEVAGPLAASADRLVVPSKGELLVLDAATGEVAWSEHVGPLTAPPLVRGESVYVAIGEQLTSYNIADGSKKWASDVGLVEQRPAATGTHVYVPVSDGRVIALVVETGEHIWEFDAGIKPTEPLVYGDRVFVGSAAKEFCSIRIRDGTEDWCFRVGAGIIGSAVADESHVYYVALDNLLRAHDRGNGALRWKKDLRYRPSAGPTLVGTTVSAPGRFRQLQAFQTATGAPDGQLTLPEALVAVPVFIEPENGQPTRLAALAGGLPNLWKLTLAGPPPPAPPTLPVGPVTVLPGLAVPLAARSSRLD